MHQLSMCADLPGWTMCDVSCDAHLQGLLLPISTHSILLSYVDKNTD
jgi:hypothetical protein